MQLKHVVCFKCLKNSDFDTEDKEQPGRQKTMDDVDLQALLDKDDIQREEQLAETLNKTLQGISKCLHVIEKIQKGGKWVPHELIKRQTEKRKATSEIILLLWTKRKGFLRRIVTGDEK